MVKAPSTSTKFKPWRRGVNKKSKGSLKHQLRGQERLLQKASTEEQRAAIRGRIEELGQQRTVKQEQDRRRLNAKKSHGTRFLERQKLTRLLRKETADDVRLRLILDLVYVAHFPNAVAYMKLFRQGQRVRDLSSKPLAKRARIRDQILRSLACEQVPRVDWIEPEQYRMVPSSWTVEQERTFFGQDSASNLSASDNRFEMATMSVSHQRLLRAAEEVDEQVEVDGSCPTSFSSLEKKSRRCAESCRDSISEEDNEEIDSAMEVLKDHEHVSVRGPSDSRRAAAHGECGSNRSDCSVGDSSSCGTSSGSSSSSSSSDDEEREEEEGFSNCKDKHDDQDSDREHSDKVAKPPAASNSNPVSDADDFLIEADTGGDTVFGRAPMALALGQVRGDKSQGWATQRQRPGQIHRKGKNRRNAKY